jgi:hypothetical protein
LEGIRDGVFEGEFYRVGGEGGIGECSLGGAGMEVFDDIPFGTSLVFHAPLTRFLFFARYFTGGQGKKIDIPHWLLPPHRGEGK